MKNCMCATDMHFLGVHEHTAVDRADERREQARRLEHRLMREPPCCPAQVEPGRAGRCNALEQAVRRAGKECDHNPGGLYEYCPAACRNCSICGNHPLHRLYTMLRYRNRVELVRERFLALQDCSRRRSGHRPQCSAGTQQSEQAALLMHTSRLLVNSSQGEEQDERLLCLIRARLNASAPRLSTPPAHVSASSEPVFLFGGSLYARTSGDGWRAWLPYDPPWPGSPSMRCAQSPKDQLRGAIGMLEPQPLCLAESPDIISDAIRQQGRWHDCGKFVRMWEHLDSLCDAHAEGVLIEVGANVGACTLELLLRTNARVVAFEPSPTNLFYLTRNLRLAADRNPSIAGRVVVYPLAAGEAARQAVAHVKWGNLGNTVIGAIESQRPPAHDSTWREAHNVTVLPLATLFPRGLGQTILVKLDAQGSESHVMDGARALWAAAPRLRGIVTEVAPRWLAQHCVKPLRLLEQLRAVRPGWEVACDHGTRRLSSSGSERTCVGRAPADGPPKRSLRRNRTRTKHTTARSILGLPYERLVPKPTAARWRAAAGWAARCQEGSVRTSER